MGLIKKPPPCVRFAAVFSSEDRFLDLVWDRLQSHWGKIAVLGQAFDFVESPYYLKTMFSSYESQIRPNLRKQMALFLKPYDPAELARDKHASNRWEQAWTAELIAQDAAFAGLLDQQASADEASVSGARRLINIDPGYLSMTKLVLASTKNREHRMYLSDGIYAEVTLAFRDQAWTAMPWTYADYQRPDVLEFLKQARKGFAQAVANALRDNELDSSGSGADS
jgi:hypothetical protein